MRRIHYKARTYHFIITTRMHDIVLKTNLGSRGRKSGTYRYYAIMKHNTENWKGPKEKYNQGKRNTIVHSPLA